MSIVKPKRRSIIAQSGIPCDFCAIDIISWFCKDCVKLICEICTCEHLKTDEGQSHEILSIEELKKNVARSIEAKREERRKIATNIENLDQQESEYVECMNSCIKNVKKEVAKVIESANSLQDTLVNDISNTRDENIKTFEKLKETLKIQDRLYDETINEIEEQLQNLSCEIVGDFMRSAESTLISLNVAEEISEVKSLSLTPNGNADGYIRKCIGSLTSNFHPVRIGIEPSTDVVDAESPTLLTELEILNKFEPSWGSPVWSVSIANDGRAWIGTGDKILKLMDRDGKESLKVRMDYTPLHTKTTSDNDVIVTHALKSTKINRVTETGKVREYSDITPYNAFGVTLTEGGNLLACTTDRKLMKFFQNGDIMQIIDLEIDPYQITVTNKGRYLVRGGDQLLTVHSIADPIELRQEWKIDPIQCDRYGNIVCGSRETGSGIYVLNQYGLFLQQFPLKDQIYDLAIDKDDILWIATRSGNVIVARYLEHQ